MPDPRQILSNSSSIRRKDIKKAPWLANQQVSPQEVVKREEEYRTLLLLRMTVALMINKKIITRMLTGLFEFLSALLLPFVSCFVLFYVTKFFCSSIQVLWASIIRSALQSVLSMKPNDSSIELQLILDTVCQLYSSKIAADLQADFSHIRRQTLPEFMYSTYLFQTGEPSAAKHALTEFISSVYFLEKVHDLSPSVFYCPYTFGS
jgi:hypothetical protein